jgi:hypothetical protein
MQVTKTIFPFIITFLLGCSNSGSELVEITYLNEDEKCIDELTTFRYLTEEDYEKKFRNNLNMDLAYPHKKIKHGKYLKFYECDWLGDSIIYVDGQTKEIFRYYKDGQLSEHKVFDVIEGDGIIDKVLVKEEVFWKNGHLKSKVEYKYKIVSVGGKSEGGNIYEGQSCEFATIPLISISYEENGQCVDSLYYDKNGRGFTVSWPNTEEEVKTPHYPTLNQFNDFK